MNIRRGMGRLARVLTVIYVVGALAISADIGRSAYVLAGPGLFDDLPVRLDPAKPNWTQYSADIAGHKVTFLEPDEKALAVDVKKWVREHSVTGRLIAAGKAALVPLGLAALLYAALWGGYRTLRWVALGFVDRPPAA
jgi:hypothetical protein